PLPSTDGVTEASARPARVRLESWRNNLEDASSGPQGIQTTIRPLQSCGQVARKPGIGLLGRRVTRSRPEGDPCPSQTKPGCLGIRVDPATGAMVGAAFSRTAIVQETVRP